MAGERYLDPEESVDERVRDLLGRMTLDEKLGQLTALSAIEVPPESLDQAPDLLSSGVGFLDLAQAGALRSPREVAGYLNAIQHWLMTNTRLGIPTLAHFSAGSDSGLFSFGGLRFPQGLGLSATFAPASVRAMAREMRDQLMSVGIRLAHSPAMDIGRDPRGRQIAASVGEDPYLAGRMAVAFVRGLQSESLKEGVAATGKHFLGHGLSVGGLAHAPVHLGRRQLREVFAEPFAAAIRDADLACIMSAAHSIDGLPTSASRVLLTELLRDDLGFDGLVVSDSQALDLLVSQLGVAADAGDAAARSLRAGLDVEFPRSSCFSAALKEQLDTSELDVGVLNRAVARVLQLKMRLGLFEAPMVDAAVSESRFATPAQRDLARGLATQSMVLLKNAGGLLPLKASGRISIIGPAACGVESGCELLSRAEPEFSGADWSPRQGIEERAGSTAVVRAAKGCESRSANSELLDQAVALAHDSDVVILVLGDTSGADFGTATGRDTESQPLGHFAEAGRLDLPAAQLELLSALRACDVQVVCVLAGGRIYALESLVEQVDALVLSWSPGDQGGAALADLLFGDSCFSGRLPVTLVRHVGQVPAYYNRKAGGRTDAATKPLFPFGFGLSYCHFEYAQLQCPESVDTHGVLRIAFELSNNGDRDADEIVQIYGHDLVASVARPVQQLIGFNRVSVPAGETITCKFRVDLSQFAYFDEAMDFVVEPGEVDLLIGGSSDDVRLQQRVRLTGDRRVLSQRQIVATQATAP